MGKKLLTFALCLFLGMSVTLAQNRIITGTVTGAEDGFPIPGAAVFVEGTNIGTVTDVDGNRVRGKTLCIKHRFSVV